MEVNKFLHETLTPMIDGIKITMTESLQLDIFGIQDISNQSILIQMGNVWENFWNTVFSKYATNLLEDGNLIIVEGKNRQIDHLFSPTKNKNGKLYYLESKCNLNFDSEKSPASNSKVKKVAYTIQKNNPEKKTLHGYFIPCVMNVPDEMRVRYKDIKLYGVSEIISIIKKLPFTAEEFEYFLKTEARDTFYKKYRSFWGTDVGMQEIIDYLVSQGYSVSKQ